MLRTPTLFVLGAGASVDFGLPLGTTLATEIARKTDIKYEDGVRQISGDPLIMTALRKVAQQNSENVNEYLSAGRTIAAGVQFTRSIDSFLHKHENEKRIKLCAKLAIAQIIVEHEKKSSLFVDGTRANSEFKSNKIVMESWLEDFFYIIQEHVSKGDLEHLLKNLMIVNFNYDRCIEHFLMHAIRKVYQNDESTVAEMLKHQLKIVHPYGSIGELLWQSPNGVAFGGHDYPHHDYLLKMAEGLRTFNEEMQDNETVWKVRGMVQHARRICFVGFHFHEPNIEMLKIERADGVPQVFATAFERSEGAISVIRPAVADALGIKDPGMIHMGRNLDCKKFFAEHGDVLAM